MEEKQHPVYRLYRALYDLNHPTKRRWALRVCVRWHAGTLPFSPLVLDVGGMSEEDMETAQRDYIAQPNEVGRLLRFLQYSLQRKPLVIPRGLEYHSAWLPAFVPAIGVVREIRAGGYGDALLAAAAGLCALRDMGEGAAGDEMRAAMAEADANGGHDWEVRVLRAAVRQLQAEAVACDGRYQALRIAHRSLTEENESERRRVTRYFEKNTTLEGDLRRCREELDGCEEYNRVMRSSLPRH